MLDQGLISEQGDVRKLVEELANRLDRSQEVSSTAQSEVSTNVAGGTFEV